MLLKVVVVGGGLTPVWSELQAVPTGTIFFPIALSFSYGGCPWVAIDNHKILQCYAVFLTLKGNMIYKIMLSKIRFKINT